MAPEHLVFVIINIFVLIFGISLGRSILVLKLRKEENRKRELELELLEKRTTVLKQGRKIASNLEELLYKAQIQKEIEQIIRDKGDS
jgi:KaiC/GvpD/RAD55 family RecA-like ATPase